MQPFQHYSLLVGMDQRQALLAVVHFLLWQMNVQDA